MLFHVWSRSYRPTFWEQEDPARKAISHRNSELVKQALQGNDPYGWLGSARTLQQFQEYCGIDFASRAVSSKAKRGYV
jgi:hypothetical protein